jgi:hypothetical protein
MEQTVRRRLRVCWKEDFEVSAILNCIFNEDKKKNNSKNNKMVKMRMTKTMKKKKK